MATESSSLGPIAISIPEAAKLLGVCSRIVSDLIKKGDLPALRIGSRVLCNYRLLVKYVEEHTDSSGRLVRPDRSVFITEHNRTRAKNLYPKERGGKQ